MSTTTASTPEISRSVEVNGISTNYHDEGEGPVVVLIHGSGPGVTAWANWRLVIPELSKKHRVIAPDVRGFGYTERLEGEQYSADLWVSHLVGLLDALGVDKASIVGNSFGGSLALHLATRFPERIDRLVLMGSVGVSFPITEGLEKVWGFKPSLEAMQELLGVFAFDSSLANDRELAALRLTAAIRPGVQEAYSSMFPAPRQESVNRMAVSEELIKGISHSTLIVHGRDDQVIPLQNSYRLLDLIDNSQLHVFGRCGHWVQIEHTARFVSLVEDFLAETP
ncbi:alpha/beta fold hydrolase [Pseudarthrobacter sp. S9]|uniref:alpha/beta fold hydrolase n=1 Tax=Pseudarthrobacter sp. S9 TaxID=3418421 RepID=UPI003D0608A0